MLARNWLNWTVDCDGPRSDTVTRQTNAQSALQAAATISSGSSGYHNANNITDLAYQFKTWLDQHDDRSQQPTPTRTGTP
jgi:hypothetical protein